MAKKVLSDEEQKAREAKKNARKAKNKKNWDETMGVLDAAQTALTNYPDLTDIGIDINLNYASNPLIFLFTILKHTKGIDYLYELIGTMLWPLCETLEYSVKAVFMAQLTEMISCTLSNMRISEDLINNGFTINLKDIDILNILAYSPLGNQTTSSMEFFKVKKKDENGNVILDEEGNPVYESKSIGPSNVGRFFYFGCEEFEKNDDLIKSPDFNALLWYVKNRANGRVVWYGSKNQSDPERNSQCPDNPTLEKKDGILTLEYHNNGKSLIKADGSPYYLQSPSENCLHVFIGNTHEVSKDSSYVSNKRNFLIDKEKSEDLITDYNKILKELKQRKADLLEEKNSDNLSISDRVNIEIDLSTIDNYIEDMVAGNKKIKKILGKKSGSTGTGEIINYCIDLKTKPVWVNSIHKQLLEKSLNEIKSEIKSAQTVCNAIDNNNVKVYRPASDNYYYKKFLMTFNNDYIWSVKLFNPKVVAAQLIDALTGCLSVDMNLSVETQILKSEVKNIVQAVCNDDDNSYTVNDCFFTFTNDGYNALLEKAELAKMGFNKYGNDNTTIAKSNAKELLIGLDEISKKNDNVSEVVSKTLQVAAQNMASADEKDTIDANVGGKMSFDFIENLMNELATVIVTSVVSPKLYIMILVNFQIMKLNTHFNVGEFIQHYKQIMIAMIRDVRDQLIKVFTNIIMEVLKDIIKELSYVMAMEQIQYYKNLITQCMECIKISRRTNDWTMAQVDYADIEKSEPEESQDNDNC